MNSLALQFAKNALKSLLVGFRIEDLPEAGKVRITDKDGSTELTYQEFCQKVIIVLNG